MKERMQGHEQSIAKIIVVLQICSVRYSGDGFCIRKWYYLSNASEGISTFKSTGFSHWHWIV